MNDATTAKRTVLVSMFLLAAIAVYRNKSAGATYNALWGVGVVSLILSILADFVPSIAGPFAALVVLGSFTKGGDRLIQSALGKASAASPSPAPARPAPTRTTTAPAPTIVPAPANPSGPRHIPVTPRSSK